MRTNHWTMLCLVLALGACDTKIHIGDIFGETSQPGSPSGAATASDPSGDPSTGSPDTTGAPVEPPASTGEPGTAGSTGEPGTTGGDPPPGTGGGETDPGETGPGETGESGQVCHPLNQDCPFGEMCVYDPATGGETWKCIAVSPGGGGETFAACEAIDSCEVGSLCLNSSLAVECLGSDACCLPLCDLDQANTCPGADQTCHPWYEAGFAPPGYETVGVCLLPA